MYNGKLFINLYFFLFFLKKGSRVKFSIYKLFWQINEQIKNKIYLLFISNFNIVFIEYKKIF